MKKGCLIVLVVILVLVIAATVAGYVAYQIGDQRFGIRLAPEIHHDTYATADTRIRLVIRPDGLLAYLQDYLPKEAREEIYTGPFNLEDIVSHVIPHEIALLASADVLTNRLLLTLFVGERRGGPLLAKIVQESDVFSQMQQITWTSQGLELRDRGLLVAEGYLPIPEAVEQELLSIWPTRTSQPPAEISAAHLAELVIDNRNGDIMALVAAAATAAGESWGDLRQEQMADMVINIIESIHVARITADMEDKDTAMFSLRIDADAESGPGLQFLLSGMAMPQLRDMLKEAHGLTLAGEIMWDEQESAITGQYTLTGLEAFLQTHLAEEAV